MRNVLSQLLAELKDFFFIYILHICLVYLLYLKWVLVCLWIWSHFRSSFRLASSQSWPFLHLILPSKQFQGSLQRLIYRGGKIEENTPLAFPSPWPGRRMSHQLMAFTRLSQMLVGFILISDVVCGLYYESYGQWCITLQIRKFVI